MEIAKKVYLVLTGILVISIAVEIISVKLFKAPMIFTTIEMFIGGALFI